MSTPMKLAVLGAGAVTSVGNSLAATLAAIKGGVDNFRETDFRDNLGQPVIGAKLHLQDHNGPQIGGAAKLANSLTWAVEEALLRAGLHRPLPASTPILFLGDQTRPAPLVDAIRLCHRAIGHFFEEPTRLHLQAFTGGEVGCVDALVAAREFLANGAPYVVLAAADTWLRLPDITHGLKHQRILDAKASLGFIPGEATAALLLTAKPASSLIHVAGLGLAEESASLLTDEVCYGKGLAQATRAALNEAACNAHDIHLRMSDAAGEAYFAEELSNAWGRLLRAPQPKHHERMLPARSTGHIGCAFGPLMLALAWEMARDAWLPGPNILIQLSSSHTLRGAIAAHAGAA